MNGKLTVAACGLVVVSLFGCVSTMIVEKATSMADTSKDQFSFDLSTPGANSGRLLVECVPPTNQILVDRYAIAIDSNPPLVVSKRSDSDIRVNAGKHSVRFYATSGKPGESEKNTFGRVTTKEIYIPKDTTTSVKYTGPYRLFGEGKIEIKNN